MTTSFIWPSRIFSMKARLSSQANVACPLLAGIRSNPSNMEGSISSGIAANLGIINSCLPLMASLPHYP